MIKVVKCGELEYPKYFYLFPRICNHLDWTGFIFTRKWEHRLRWKDISLRFYSNISMFYLLRRFERISRNLSLFLFFIRIWKQNKNKKQIHSAMLVERSVKQSFHYVDWNLWIFRIPRCISLVYLSVFIFISFHFISFYLFCFSFLWRKMKRVYSFSWKKIHICIYICVCECTTYMCTVMNSVSSLNTVRTFERTKFC